MGHRPAQRVIVRPTSVLPGADVEAIERATLDVVVPDEVLSLPGWLVPLFDGTVERARSAVPLQHAPPDLTQIDAIAGLYQARGAVPSFRLPDLDNFAPMHAELKRRGFERKHPTWVLQGCVSDLLAMHSGPAAELAGTPDADWMDMFLGSGLDPIDGAARARALARGVHTHFVSLREDGQTLACGAAGLNHGWLSVHGVRTAQSRRGQGLAPRVLLAMAQLARELGIERVFLQVDEGNEPALTMYRRARLQVAWRYAYWQPAPAQSISLSASEEMAAPS